MNMKSFSVILKEQKDTVVFAFGRFNPPTTGHEKLINKVASVAGTSDYFIYPSFTQKPSKDPLPHSLKIAYMRKMFPKHARKIIADKSAVTAINIAVKLYEKGYKNLIMVAGSDRIAEFKKLLQTYNGVEGKRHGFYKFDKIDVVSAGERDPDAEGVTGMSASKMRAAAAEGDIQSFKKGLPIGFKDAEKLFKDVRKYMNIREEKDLGQMNDYELFRDAYLTGLICNIGDMTDNGEIIRRGTNYVTIVTESGDYEKVWLKDLQEQKVKQDPDIKKRPGTQPAKYYAKDADGDEMAKSTKQARARHFEKGAKKDDDDPSAYKPAPGDKSADTKPSKYTKKFKQMFGEKDNPRIPRKKGQHRNSPSHSDLYTDENPVGTIKGLGFKDVETAKASIKKIENSGKTHAHKIQAAVAMEQRAKVAGKKEEAAIYRKYIDKMKEKTKEMQKENAPDTQDAMKRYKDGKAGFTDIAHLKAKGLIPRADGTKRKSAKYETFKLVEKLAGLVKKSDKSGIPYSILKKVYDRGMAAWRTGHRPGTTPQQWGYARVNSFIVGGKTRTTGDADLWKKYKGMKETLGETIEPNPQNIIEEAIDYHLECHVPLSESIFRMHSESYYEFYKQLKVRYNNKELKDISVFDEDLLKTDIGEFELYEGKQVPLDVPLFEDEHVELNVPRRGGPKKFYVYVKDGDKVKKVTFGDTTGLKVKLDDVEARKNFAARHNCDTANDKTTARYWSCRLPYYADSLGLSGGGRFFW